MVTLTGTFTRLDGGPATGTVKITPSRSPILDSAGRIVISGPQTFPLDKDGKIAVTLPATDDPSLGEPFSYAIRANFAHTEWTLRNVTLPSSEFEVDLTGGAAEKVTPPNEFPTPTKLPTPNIIRRGDKYTATLDYEHLIPTEGVTYYTAPGAWSSNRTGLSPEEPLQLARILEKPDVGTIILDGGEYHRGEAVLPTGQMLTTSIRWEASGVGGRPQITGWNTHTATTWTSVSGAIYSTSRSGTEAVIDLQNLTEWGDYTVYTRRATPAEITGPGEWAIDGSIVHVWCLGDTDLTVAENREQIRLQITSRGGVVATGEGVTQYVKGVDFFGCSNGMGKTFNGGIIAYDGATIIAEDCAVKYNVSDNGFTVNGGNLVAIDCEASSNTADGFNYHDTAYAGTEFIEIGCVSHHNGTQGTTNNGSTAHEAAHGIRVNGQYFTTGGPVVADVNEAQSWNIGCVARDSTASVAFQNSAWRTDATEEHGSPATMWVDHCVAESANTGLHATGTSRIFHRGTTFGDVTVETDGDVTTFI